MGLKHIFYTGDFHVGKSSELKKNLEKYKMSEIASVITTTRKDSENSKTVFLNGIEAGKLENHKVLYAYPNVFNTVGVEALKILPETKIVAIDEIGILERNADKYCKAVMNLLDQTYIPVIGVLRKSADTPLADGIRNHKNVHLIEIVK